MEKSENSTKNEILNQDFFDTIKNSKKINAKSQKIKELSKYFSSHPDSPQSSEINNKMPDLYDLLLINLNENNNNYVLAQMELIQILGKTIKHDDKFSTFIKQSLPKLFDKFYLGNNKINETLIKMFSEFIEFKIMTIKDFYQYIENIPMEEEDNYRINILNFLYENIDKDKTVLLNNIPKSLNELIKKLINDNESDISETASKILNILINRDIEANKKKDTSIPESKTEEKNMKDKGGTGISSFVTNIVSAIKQNVENNNGNKDNNIDNLNKDNNVNQSERKNLSEEKKDNKENIKVENEIKNFELKEENDIEKNSEEKSDINNKIEEGGKQEINEEDKKEDKTNIEKENINEVQKDIKEIEINNKKNEEKDIQNNNKADEKIEEIKENNKEEISEDKKGDKEDEKKEEIKEDKKEESKEEITEEIKKETKEEQKEEKKDEIIKEIKEESKDEKKEEEVINQKVEKIQKEITKNVSENFDNKEIINKENKKEDNETEKEIKETSKEEEIINKRENQNIDEKSKETKEEIKEKNENMIENYLESKIEENQIKKEEKIIENNESNTNVPKEEVSNNDVLDNQEKNIKENIIEKEEEAKQLEVLKEEPKKEEKIEEPKIINKEEEKTKNDEPLLKEMDEVSKKEAIEDKQKEDLKSEEDKKINTKEDNKDVKIESPEINNIKDEKKEETNEKPKDEPDNKTQEEKKDEDKKETKNKDEKKKPGGIKSKISKFRKNKNKNKDGGFQFELVIDKKKEAPIEEKKDMESNEEKEEIKEKIKDKEKDIVEERKEEIKPIEEKQKENIEEKPKEEVNEEKHLNNAEKNNKEETIKIEEKTKEEKNEENIKAETKEEIKEQKAKEVEIKEETIQKNNEESEKEKSKEEIIPKEEIKPKENLLKPIKEEKIEDEIQTPEKIKEENKKESQKEIQNSNPESKPDSNLEKNPEKNNPQSQNLTEEKTNDKSTGVNQESLNEFEKKLQLALEQEEKDKNNFENLVENIPAPVKQKKEDPKFDEIKSILGKEIVESLFSPKWEVKKHGFELINEFINTKQKDSYNLNDLIEYMKLKLKNYKETNFNINREAINIYINMIKKKIIPKDILTNIIIAYHEKLSDIKLKDNLIELINNSFDILEPSNILKQIITKISKKNNAKLLIEYATFLGNVVEEYDVKDLPNIDIIDFCKILANNSNPQVRTSAISLLCILYKYLGKDVKTLTRDIKESTLKLIDAELDKVKVIDPKESLIKKKKAASVMEIGNAKSNNNSKGKDLIPPQDISKKITPQIIKLLNSAKWAEKKEGCETIEKILTSANMRILPNGLNTLMTTIKKKLSDSNKNFVKMLVALLSKLIEGMKAGFKQWAKPIALTLIPNLADKNQLMRNECQNCFDKWVEFAGFDSLVVHFPKFLINENVEIRIEIMNFFMKYKDKFNKSTGESVYKDMMNPLLICLQDRSSNVRNLAEEIIKISLVYNPITNYYKKIEDFKPAIAKTIKQVLDKIKSETSTNESQPDSNKISEPEINSISNHLSTEPNLSSNHNSINKTNEKTLKNINPKSSNKKLTIQTSDISLKTESSIQDDSDKNESTTEDNISNFNTISNVSNKKKSEKDSNSKTLKKIINNTKRTKPKRKLSEDDLVNPLGTAMNKQMPASTVDHLASNSTILRKKEFKSFQKNASQVVKPSNAVFLINVKVIPNKAKRYDKDKRTKFNLETVSKDYFIKLKEQCKGLFTEMFAKKIFSDDFRKQVEAFKDMKGQIDKKINIPIYFDNLDLILKIIGIKILNNLNPTLMKNFFEFLDSLYTVLYENKYKINDTESNLIISLLIDKLSLNNNTLKEHLLSLLNKYIEFMDINKIMVTVINVALNKNNKIKTDILDLTIDLVSQEKLNISTKVYAKLLCRFLPFYENVIRTKTLALFQEIYSNIGDELWNMIEISEKDKEFLEENLCADDDEEDEEREGEEEEDDEEGNEDINNEDKKNNDKNETGSNDKTDNGIDDNKKTNKDSEKMKIFGNKNGPLTKEDLDTILDNLLIDDQNEKLNTIIIIHETVCGKFAQNKEVLIPNIDKIISTFKAVSHKLFYMKDLNSIPIKFAKYLAIVFCKLASNKELISHLSYNVLLDISRELLRYLLINGLDRIGDQQEGNIIFKSINSTMLRILENCDITFVITALLELIKEFLEKDDKNLVNLAIKCLLKTTHNLSENINNIQISKILLQIHLLLLSLQKNNKDLAKKSQTSALIINTVKNIVGDFVKLKKEKILEEYSKSVKNHQFNDKFLLKWIKAALEKV